MGWIDGGLDRRPRRRPKRRKMVVYSVSDVADMLAVDRSTVFKYLSVNDSEVAVISPEDWFKLPGGEIRIRQRAVDLLLGV